MKRWFRRLPLSGKLALGSAALIVLGVLIGQPDGTGWIGLGFVGLLAAALLWAVRQVWRGFRRRRTGLRQRPGQPQRQAVQSAPVKVPTAAAAMPVQPPLNWAPSTRPPAVAAPGIGDVLALTPGQFEDLAGALLVRLGYANVQRVGGSGDLGADLVARDPQGRSTIVQCKRYAPGSTIGTPVVQTFIGMMTVHHRAERGVIVSTVGYTQPAVDLARQHGVALVDGEALLLMLHLTGTGPGAVLAQ